MPTTEFLKDQAAWSDFTTRNVDPNAPTNLASRARRQRAMADQDAYAEAVAQDRAEQTKSLMLRDRRAQSYFFGLERLNMAKELHDTQLQAAEGKLAAERDMLPLRKNALIAQEKSAVALERARTQAADFKAQMDEQEHNDTAGFTDFILRSGVRRGTPEFADKVAEAKMKFPAVPTALFDDAWKMTGSIKTPQEVQASIAARKQANPELTTLKTGLARAEVKESGASALEKPDAQTEIDSLKNKIAAAESATGTTSKTGMGDVRANEPAVAASAIPTLKSKDEFDKLSSGAEYIRDGRRYRKP